MYLILDSVLFFSQWIHVAAKTVHYEREREREREKIAYIEIMIE